MSTDRWVFVQDDGTIILREENDGWQYLRHGPSVWAPTRRKSRRHFTRSTARGKTPSPVGFSRIGPNGSYSLSTARDDVQR